jgi:hypothetical protein
MHNKKILIVDDEPYVRLLEETRRNAYIQNQNRFDFCPMEG